MEDNFICAKEELKELKENRTENTKEIVKRALLAAVGLAGFAASIATIPLYGVTGQLLIPGVALTAVSISLLVSAVKKRAGMKEQIEQKQQEVEHEELLRGKLR